MVYTVVLGTTGRKVLRVRVSQRAPNLKFQGVLAERFIALAWKAREFQQGFREFESLTHLQFNGDCSLVVERLAVNQKTRVRSPLSPQIKYVKKHLLGAFLILNY